MNFLRAKAHLNIDRSSIKQMAKEHEHSKETKVYWNLMAVSNSIFEAIMIRAALHSGIHCSDFKPFHLFHATWHDNLKEVNTTFF